MGSVIATLIFKQWWVVALSIAAAGAPSLDIIGGQKLPSVQYRTDSGARFELNEFDNRSFILLPVFTRCEMVCAPEARELKQQLESYPVSDRPDVMIMSFDPQDTREDLSQFRAKHQLPKSWTIAIANREQTSQLLDQIGFRYTTLGPRAFDHPAIAYLVGPGLRIRGIFNPLQRDTWPRNLKISASEGRIIDILPKVVSVSIVGLFLSGVATLFIWMRRSRKGSDLCANR